MSQGSSTVTGPIPPDMARRLVAHAPGLTRVLTHPVTGRVLDVDRASYKVPKSLRNWLMVRDGWCRFPGCFRRAISCEADHTIPWEHGGTTSADNLAHLCRKHHRLKGLTDWRVAQVKAARGKDGAPPIGTLSWVSPTGRSYVTRPAEGVGTTMWSRCAEGGMKPPRGVGVEGPG
ncbi:HNH endonuclease signature motif containing protein [Rathayibacter sp. KR2-224]|uniref:HNH endonuclease signature motif containing protein n=1 Tax=Rathayibacter sp. KR2-224 TaxID=3400913 RepID=UPI003C0D269E